jgi:outer membrane receptor protein involved in Fe transport
VAETLEPHGLELERADGIYLIKRAGRDPPPDGPGALLLIVRDASGSPLQVPVTVTGGPGFSAVLDLGYGVFQLPAPNAGKLSFQVAAEGYDSATRSLELEAGQVMTLTLRMTPEVTRLSALTVSASRYLLMSPSQFFIDQRALQNLPGMFEDPLRAAQRLPGTAGGGVSARSHFRGGEENESAIYLNGLRLVDPFHIRDFHNIFSSIDARTISGVETWTGGFPVSYGDRMSGVLLLNSRTPEARRHTELGVSVFNTSLLHAGHSDDQRYDWLLSARRSNLEWVLDPDEHGEPKYNDLFASLGLALSARSTLSLNALRASDQVLVITEHKPEEREQANSDTLNEYLWANWKHDWSASLSSQTVLSLSRFENDRRAVSNDVEQLVALVRDQRRLDSWAVRQDWRLDLDQGHLLRLGWEFASEDAKYDYRAEAEYSGFYLAYPGVEESVSRTSLLGLSGNRYGAYLSDRFQLLPETTMEAGIRWDHQDWPGGGEDQWSPRVNLLHHLGPELDLRLTWGRYHQSQGLNQLQVEDGVEDFYRAQRADHIIAAAHWRFAPTWSARLELYRKRYDHLRPRFENLLDPLPLIPELEPDRIRVAPEAGSARGLELSIEYNGGQGLDWWASYSLARVTDRVNGRDEPRNWDQRHLLQAGLSWERGPWTLGMALKARSGWPTTLAELYEVGEDEEGEPEFELVYGPRNAERLGSFLSVDFRVARRWSLPRGRLSAFLELSNAFNRDNECCVDYDLDDEDLLERSVDHWLGTTPAAGLLWEF